MTKGHLWAIKYLKYILIKFMKNLSADIQRLKVQI